jgi:hypothetical protein
MGNTFDQSITPEEVQSWFGKSKQKKLKPQIYRTIACQLNKFRGPSAPLTIRSSPLERKSGMWDINGTAKAAKRLLQDMPAMLSHWRDRSWDPKDQAAYITIDALNEALSAAMPYIEHPLGEYDRANGRKAPKRWHSPSVLIAKYVMQALLDAGESLPSITHGSLVVRIVKKVLVRMQFPQSETVSRDALAAHLKRWKEKYGNLVPI